MILIDVLPTLDPPRLVMAVSTLLIITDVSLAYFHYSNLYFSVTYFIILMYIFLYELFSIILLLVFVQHTVQ